MEDKPPAPRREKQGGAKKPSAGTLKSLRGASGVRVWEETMPDGHQKVCAVVMKTDELKKSETWALLIDAEDLSVQDDDKRISDVPKDILRLQHLTAFHLSYGALKKIPQRLFQLQLQKLALDQNDIREIDAKIKTATHLVRLDLSSNKISKFARELTELGALETLNLSANTLVEIPKEIGVFPRLKELDLSANGISVLPDAIGDIKTLQSLDLCNNYITHLPKGLGNLSQLRDLRLSKNRMTSLTHTLGKLDSLRSLLVNSNRLKELPKNLTNCCNLVTLHAKSNDLRHMFCSPPALQVLLLDKNELEHVPDHVYNCTELETLSMEDNVMASLDARVGRLRKLRILRLGGNDIPEIPEEICRLVELRHLSMRSARIRSLPSRFDSLSSLTMLDLTDNPLDHQLYAAQREGIKQILQFVKSQRELGGELEEEAGSTGSSDSEVGLVENNDSSSPEDEAHLEENVFDSVRSSIASGSAGDEGRDVVSDLHPLLSPGGKTMNRMSEIASSSSHINDGATSKPRPQSESHVGLLRDKLTLSPAREKEEFAYDGEQEEAGEGRAVPMRQKPPLTQKDSGYTSQTATSGVASISFQSGRDSTSSYVPIPATDKPKPPPPVAKKPSIPTKPKTMPKPGAAQPKPQQGKGNRSALLRRQTEPAPQHLTAADGKPRHASATGNVDHVMRESVFPPPRQ